jgi:hypothetical protein
MPGADSGRTVVRSAYASVSLRCLALLLLATLIEGCSDPQVLGTGDTLIATFEPGLIYAMGAAPVTGTGCTEAGGATLYLVGVRNDGTAAGGVTIELWLSGPATASLSKSSVTLGNDGTDTSVCLMPGVAPGTVTLNARSGTILTTAPITVAARSVPSDGTLLLTSSIIAGGSPQPGSSCGAPAPAACAPGQGRATAFSVQGLGSSMSPLPDAAGVVVSTTFGWLVTGTGSCSDPAQQASVNLTLSAGVAETTLCFPDLAGTAVVTARSGAVTTMVTINVPAVAESVVLVPSAASAVSGAAVSFVAFVSDCAGNGVPGVPVAMLVKTGEVDFGSAGASVAKSGSDGLLTFSGTAKTLPLAVEAELLAFPQVACSSTIGLEAAQ